MPIITKILCCIFVVSILIVTILTINGVINKIKANEQAIQEMRRTIESLEKEFTRWRSRAFLDEKYINEHVKEKKR